MKAWIYCCSELYRYYMAILLLVYYIQKVHVICMVNNVVCHIPYSMFTMSYIVCTKRILILLRTTIATPTPTTEPPV